MSSALSFQNVQKNYGEFQALSNVSFEVEQGEFFALLGQNGAGKTTLINCLAGILKRSSGEMKVFGEDPEKNPEFTKMKLGIVQQEVAFDPFFNPPEILSMQRGLYGLPKDEKYINWLLEKLSLTDKKNTHGRNLSGGMKRRIMIAKALVHKPDILILDEPTAGVDIALRKNLWEFMHELQSEYNTTILLTTHYLEEAEALAKRTAILHEGSIQVCDETSILLASKKRTLEVFLEDDTVKTIILEKDDSMGEIISQFSNIKNIKIREPKLEEVFLDFVGK